MQLPLVVGCGSVAQVSIVSREIGTSVSVDSSTLRNFGCKCTGLTCPGLVSNGFVWIVRQSTVLSGLGLNVGFLGAFTTFSAFSFDSVQTFTEWRSLAGRSQCGSLNTVVCIGMCYLGMQLGSPESNF